MLRPCALDESIAPALEGLTHLDLGMDTFKNEKERYCIGTNKKYSISTVHLMVLYCISTLYILL